MTRLDSRLPHPEASTSHGRKRLAFLLPDMRGGGAERVALTLMEHSLSHGHDIDLLLLNRTGALLDLIPPTVRVIDLKATRLRNAIRPLRRYFVDSSPDAI